MLSVDAVVPNPGAADVVAVIDALAVAAAGNLAVSRPLLV